MVKKVCFSGNLLFILIILVMQAFIISSNTLENGKIMLDAIEVCNTVKFVRNSTYISTQCSVTVYKETFQANENLAMCVVVYDIMNKICIYDNKTTVNNEKLKVPNASPEFDLEIRNLEPKSKDYTNFLNGFCKNVTNIFSNLNSKIQTDSRINSYTRYVQEILLGQEDCTSTCHQHKEVVNPFCLIFLWANNLFNSISSSNLIDNNSHTKANKKFSSTVQIQETTVIPKPIDDTQQKNDKVLKPVDIINNNLPKPKTKLDSLVNIVRKSDESKTNSVNSKLFNKSNIVDDQKKNILIEQMEHQRENKNTVNIPINNDKTIDMISKTKGIEEGNLDTQVDPSEDHETKKGNIEDIINTDIKDSLTDLDDTLFNPVNQGEQGARNNYNSSDEKDEVDSHFFTYFSIFSIFCIGLYIGYHNKQKILAMVLEGRRSRRSRGSRRRPSSASYRKLDSNLEEAVTSQCSSNTTHVIY